MYGKGIWEGLKVTLKHFIMSYVDDFRWGRKRYYTPEGIAHRRSPDTAGIFTVQYPDEKLPVPEEFRFIPFLIYDEVDGQQKDRCTSCGICAKVCPPQCIWIVQTNDPETGRPIPEPQEFFIDIDICMNCGFCAEFCPFDAIKMDHDYELSVYDRHENNIFNKARLSKPASYYASIRPTNYEREEAIRREKEAKKAARKGGGARGGGARARRAAGKGAARGRAAQAQAKPAAETPAAQDAAAQAAAATEAAKGKPSSSEEARKARLARARARQAARRAQQQSDQDEGGGE